MLLHSPQPTSLSIQSVNICIDCMDTHRVANLATRCFWLSCPRVTVVQGLGKTEDLSAWDRADKLSARWNRPRMLPSRALLDVCVV